MINTYEENGLRFIEMENELLKVIFLPQIGGKMIKLINKITGTNFLLEPQNETKSYKPAFHGALFENYDTSGFDECFPTVEACKISTKSAYEISFPDHGQLWSKKWGYEISNDGTFIRTTKGINWDYSFSKQVKLEENKFIIDYMVENFEDEPFPYIWAAHPLLNVEPEDVIYLTDEIQNVIAYWTNAEEIAKQGDKLEWPYLDGVHDFSVIPKADFGKSIKIFSKKLNDPGWCAFHKSKNRESLLISFDTERVPYLGIWLCYGGWPVNSKNKHFTIALEPTNACCDSLEKAIKENACGIIQPNAKNKWRIEFAVVNE
jgi:galactose mutarotase-like enzyme